MHQADLIYECSMCGESFIGATVADLRVALVALAKTRRYVNIDDTMIHRCEGGGLGLAKVVGGKPTGMATMGSE